MTEIPRRIQFEKFSPAERAIYEAVQAVEAMAADVRLTDAVILLQAARDSVADYIDNIWPARRYVSSEPEVASPARPQRDIFIAAIRTLREQSRVDANCEASGHRNCAFAFMCRLDEALAILEAEGAASSAPPALEQNTSEKTTKI